MHEGSKVMGMGGNKAVLVYFEGHSAENVGME